MQHYRGIDLPADAYIGSADIMEMDDLQMNTIP